MKKLIIFTFLLMVIAHTGFPQNNSNSSSGNQQSIPGAQPDIPGSLVIDFGSNFFQNAPDNMDLKVWGSRGVNIYYMHNISFAEGYFSFNPGLGVGFEKFSFKNDITFNNPTGDDSLQVVELEYDEVKKSQLGGNYIDLPLELRFYTNNENQNRGLMIGLGGKISYLYGSYTKIKYEHENTAVKTRTKRSYNLNPLRYGLQARIGFQGINLFGYYGLSPVFEKDVGPQGTDATNFKLGLSVSLF